MSEELRWKNRNCSFQKATASMVTPGRTNRPQIPGRQLKPADPPPHFPGRREHGRGPELVCILARLHAACLLGGIQFIHLTTA